jgi:hypothetical protein
MTTRFPSQGISVFTFSNKGLGRAIARTIADTDIVITIVHNIIPINCGLEKKILSMTSFRFGFREWMSGNEPFSRLGFI